MCDLWLPFFFPFTFFLTISYIQVYISVGGSTNIYCCLNFCSQSKVKNITFFFLVFYEKKKKLYDELGFTSVLYSMVRRNMLETHDHPSFICMCICVCERETRKYHFKAVVRVIPW